MQERILETADRLFYGQGIRAVGVDTIAAEIGISKRTLYNHFPSKDDLIVAYLSRRLRPAAPSDRPPLEQILGAFDRLERTIATGVFRGCPFVNAVAELKEALNGEDVEAIQAKTQALIQASMKLGEAMYSAQQGAEGGDEAAADDGVVDAEFEEVDDSKPSA